MRHIIHVSVYVPPKVKNNEGIPLLALVFHLPKILLVEVHVLTIMWDVTLRLCRMLNQIIMFTIHRQKRVK